MPFPSSSSPSSEEDAEGDSAEGDDSAEDAEEEEEEELEEDDTEGGVSGRAGQPIPCCAKERFERVNNNPIARTTTPGSTRLPNTLDVLFIFIPSIEKVYMGMPPRLVGASA
ncbi:MAG: hypothetical protein QMD05_10410 [Candidatus Brocadiaceae bacterium]|nr:hypothetical protein [Candidatus Brocadiaceae bacterium]